MLKSNTEILLFMFDSNAARLGLELVSAISTWVALGK